MRKQVFLAGLMFVLLMALLTPAFAADLQISDIYADKFGVEIIFAASPEEAPEISLSAGGEPIMGVSTLTGNVLNWMPSSGNLEINKVYSLTVGGIEKKFQIIPILNENFETVADYPNDYTRQSGNENFLLYKGDQLAFTCVSNMAKNFKVINHELYFLANYRWFVPEADGIETLERYTASFSIGNYNANVGTVIRWNRPQRDHGATYGVQFNDTVFRWDNETGGEAARKNWTDFGFGNLSAGKSEKVDINADGGLTNIFGTITTPAPMYEFAIRKKGADADIYRDGRKFATLSDEVDVSKARTKGYLSFYCNQMGINKLDDFLITKYTEVHGITVSANTGGSVLVNGEPVTDGQELMFAQGENASFSFVPDRGYGVETVMIDHNSVAAAEEYTIENISKNIAVTVSFQKLPPSIQAVSLGTPTEVNGYQANMVYAKMQNFYDVTWYGMILTENETERSLPLEAKGESDGKFAIKVYGPALNGSYTLTPRVEYGDRQELVGDEQEFSVTLEGND